MAEADGALDKTRRHKKRQLEDTLHLVMKKRKVHFGNLVSLNEALGNRETIYLPMPVHHVPSDMISWNITSTAVLRPV